MSLRVDPGSSIAGQTLAESNLRGLTGATVMAIVRGDQSVPMPAPTEVVRAGDLLAVIGSEDAIEAAREMAGPNQSMESRHARISS